MGFARRSCGGRQPRSDRIVAYPAITPFQIAVFGLPVIALGQRAVIPLRTEAQVLRCVLTGMLLRQVEPELIPEPRQILCSRGKPSLAQRHLFSAG